MRIPPHNLDAEQSVLGGLMLDGEAWDAVVDIVAEQDFYKPAHQKVFAAVQDLHKRNQPADILTVTSLLRDKNELDLIGGPAFLAEIINQTPSSANIESYAKIVNEKALIRRIIDANARISEKAYNADYENVDSFLDHVEGEIFNLSEEKKTVGLVPAKDLVKTSLDLIEERYHTKANLTGISTGYTDLDKMTAGFQPGDFIILAARPSMGKTALSLNMAQHIALREKKTVAYFSVEMGKEALMTRILASEARIHISDIRLGKIRDEAWPSLIHSASLVSEAPLFIDDTSGISPFEIRAKARRLKKRFNLDIIFIDYLQIMDLKQRVENRERQVSEISRTLKSIAKELQIPVIALSQLNRGVEGRAERQPMLSDLRESGSLEQDADLIMMLYREDYYEKDNSENKGVAELLIRKQRNGPTGSVRLKWTPESGRFDNLEFSKDMPPTPSPGKPPQYGGGKVRNFAPGGNS